MRKSEPDHLRNAIIRKIDSILWYYFVNFAPTPNNDAYNCAMGEIERFLKGIKFYE